MGSIPDVLTRILDDTGRSVAFMEVAVYLIQGIIVTIKEIDILFFRLFGMVKAPERLLSYRKYDKPK